jgi:hypothetical protein
MVAVETRSFATFSVKIIFKWSNDLPCSESAKVAYNVFRRTQLGRGPKTGIMSFER